MNFSISKFELLKALKSVQRAVPTRTTKAVLYGVLLTAKSDQLTFSAYDMEIGIQSTIIANESATLDILEEGAIVLNARYLLEIVQKLPMQGVGVAVGNGLTVTIKSGKTTYTLNGMDHREYPTIPRIDSDHVFTIPAKQIKVLIDHTVFATSMSEIRPALMGALVRISGGEISFTATDSHRLATQTVSIEIGSNQPEQTMIVPGKSLNEFAKILPEGEVDVKLQLADYQLLMQFQHITFYTRLIDANYPDIDRIFPSQYVASIEVRALALSDCIDRAALLARDNENQVVIIKVGHPLQVTANSSEIGKVLETLEPQRFSGTPLTVACNAKFLIDALKALGDSLVEAKFSGTGSAMVMQAWNDETQRHLVLPVRVGNV